jgi:hypothetical protein
MLGTNVTSQAIDDVLAGTFPASDPPAWTPGMARPAPEIGKDVRTSGVIDVSRPPGSGRTLIQQALVSLLGAAVAALVVLLAILAVGTPVALAVRGLLEVAQWLLAFIR